MPLVWIYAIVSVLVVSLVSLLGIFSFSVKTAKLNKFLLYMVSFSTGSLFGDVFFHLLPEIVEEVGFGVNISFFILSGIVFSFAIEKFVHWHHCHHSNAEDHPHPFAIMNLVGDAVHNFLDGLIIGASFLVSMPVGVATTLAVFLHEIPQEISDFGILLHGGYSRKRALFLNFLISLLSVFGAILALLLASRIESVTTFLIPFAAGNFLYIAGSDLIPELQKEVNLKKSTLQFFVFIGGIMVMYGLLYLELF